MCSGGKAIKEFVEREESYLENKVKGLESLDEDIEGWTNQFNLDEEHVFDPEHPKYEKYFLELDYEEDKARLDFIKNSGILCDIDIENISGKSLNTLVSVYEDTEVGSIPIVDVIYMLAESITADIPEYMEYDTMRYISFESGDTDDILANIEIYSSILDDIGEVIKILTYEISDQEMNYINLPKIYLDMEDGYVKTKLISKYIKYNMDKDVVLTLCKTDDELYEEWLVEE